MSATPTSNWRARVIVGGLLAVWAVLAGRLVQVQWWSRDRFTDRVLRQLVLEETIPARPGDILDRAGRLLATTTRTWSLYVDPTRIEEPWTFCREVSQALALDPDRLFERLGAHRDGRFLWVKRRLTDDEVAAVRALELRTGSWGLDPEFKRHYPQGALAAHVLGLRDIDGIGHGGVEEGLEPLLRGRDGRRKLVRDARGYVLDVLDEVDVPPQQGATVTLTIDSVVQLETERRLDQLMEECRPRSACAIVLDPASGEVVAMASRPAFDPNRPDRVPDAAWKNQAVAAVYEPGSTFKPLVVAWALEHGAIERDDEFDCEGGAYRMGRRTLHDHHPYGRLSVTDILVKSSNVGMAKIGERLGNDGLYAAAATFGFGRRTGIELPGELPGLLRPLDDWTSYSTGSIPMGQELASTPLQIIAAHAALANGGRLISPHLLLSRTDFQSVRVNDSASTALDATNVVVAPTVSADVARWVVETPLVEVVRRGTGRKAALSDQTVFGKSGTAQKLDLSTGGYSDREHVSSFVCGAPAERPRLLVLVSIDAPTLGGSDFGGTVAAPPAADILRAALRWHDDREKVADADGDATHRR
jgi:cell division protein FtsI/penicillin-binding protein 2